MAALARWRVFSVIAIVLAVASPVRAESPSTHATRAPRDIVLILDNSGSMRKNDRNFAMKHAAAEFIKNSPPNSHIGIIIFDSNVKYNFHLAPASGPTQETLLGSLQQLDYRGRWTNIPAAITQAVDELKANSREGSTRSVVLLTDGVVETGDAVKDAAATESVRQSLIPDAESNHIKIFSVALGPHSDTELLQAMSNRTAGEYFWASVGDELPALFSRIVGKIAEAGPSGQPEGSAPDVVVVSAPTPVPATPVSEESKQEPPATAVPPAVVAQETGVRPQERKEKERAAAPERRVVVTDNREAAPPKPKSGAGTVRPKAGTDWWLDGLGGLLILTVGLLGWMIARSRVVNMRGPSERHASVARSGTVDTSQSPQAYLHDLSGVTGRQRHEISNAITLIGRVAPNPEDRLGSVVIDRPTIGRRHAVIERKHYGFWLIDQHSKNGTYVNDYRVTDEVCLTHGDRVRFHEYDFEFVLAGLGLADETISVGELILLNNRGTDTRSAPRAPHQVDITSPDDPTATGRIKSGSNKGG